MLSMENAVLAINGGSSSIKFALYEMAATPALLLSGEIAGIDTDNPTFGFKDLAGNKEESITIKASDHSLAARYLIDWLESRPVFASIKAIGHRIVQGMNHTEPELITPALLSELHDISAYDPEHLPDEIKLIEVFRKKFPDLPQVACFDTSFHTAMPPVAKLLPVPRRYYAKGIHRYGFHGLSYAYLMEELERQAGSEVARGKVILAHLGSGASLAAVKNGTCLDTTMGFTPASGLPMGTRTGDLDPGVAWYLMQSEKLTPRQFSQLINHQSGLLGISETSGDMKELIKIEGVDKRAAEAVELFCYQTGKWIGSFAAVLGGLDTLVFSGGIGEHSAVVRQRVCNMLQFLGVELDEGRNLKNDAIISTESGKVSVRVINTNEELMIAKLVNRVLNKAVKN
jgi:acetate kinase